MLQENFRQGHDGEPCLQLLRTAVGAHLCRSDSLPASHHHVHPRSPAHLAARSAGHKHLLCTAAAQRDCRAQGVWLHRQADAPAAAPPVCDLRHSGMHHSHPHHIRYSHQLAPAVQLSHRAQPLDIRCFRVYLLHHFPTHRTHPKLARCHGESHQQY